MVRHVAWPIGLLIAVSGCAVSAPPQDKPAATPSVATVLMEGACSADSFAVSLKRAGRIGDAIVTGHASLTGKTKQRADEVDQQSTGPGRTYSEVALTDLHSINGISVPGSLTVYTPGGRTPSSITLAGSEMSSAWAKDGAFFGEIVNDASFGPTLSAIPVVNSDVIFTGTGCWNTTGLNLTQIATEAVTVNGDNVTSKTANYPSISLGAVSALLEN